VNLFETNNKITKHHLKGSLHIDIVKEIEVLKYFKK